MENENISIWYQSTLDFSQHPNYERVLRTHANALSSTDTRVNVHGWSPEANNNLTVEDFTGSPVAYHSMIAPLFIEALLQAEAEGCDAFIAGSFSEPILNELRSLARIPVVSMPESTYLAGAMSAHKIGFVTINDATKPQLEKSMMLHDWGPRRISGFHVLTTPVTEFDLDGVLEAPGRYLDVLVEGFRTAIKQGAEVVVPAEGMLGLMAAINGLTEIDGIPIIDVVGTTVLVAELAVNLHRRTSLLQSRAAYPAPSDAARRYIMAKASGTNFKA
ncbi:aspartate/glutamate racemase family protein [Paenarthrobacter nicotinovorans]|uniref:aspartate/glutamate racemase family protein n=1 Tax=Paenarthrobacter nicotinovorans TaxID=29320 RepID=UPI0038061E49